MSAIFWTCGDHLYRLNPKTGRCVCGAPKIDAASVVPAVDKDSERSAAQRECLPSWSSPTTNTEPAPTSSLPDDLRALREATYRVGWYAAIKDTPREKFWTGKQDAAESRILSTVSALTAERDALQEAMQYIWDALDNNDAHEAMCMADLHRPQETTDA